MKSSHLISATANVYRRPALVAVLLAVFLSGVPGGIAGIPGSIASASSGWVITGSMAAVHRGNTATLLNDGRVLVAGAADSDSSGLPSAELYQPVARIWSPTTNLPLPRVGHTATLLLDGRVLVSGGFQQGAGCFGCLLADTQIYDPVLGTWAPAAPMRVSRYGHTATRLQDGRVLVAGGDTLGFTAASSEIFDPVTGLWTLVGSMSAQRSGHTATLLASGSVLVAGGFGEFDVGYSSSAELFNPATLTWSRTASMFDHRQLHTATLLTDGRVLVAGGFNGRDVASAEIYNATTATWSLVGGMSVPRTAHTATRLTDGTVLVAGGQNRISGALASAEIFDPTSSHWSTIASMAGARVRHTATLLIDGNVLVAGGCPFSPAWACAPIPSAELYVAPVDTTSPLISSLIAPTPNASGWNNTDVTVSWSVSDPESGIVSTTGCDTTTIAAETAGTTLTCSARNAADLTASAGVRIKIDKTPPVVTFSGNTGTYTIDQTIAITCSATDALSGIATSDCPAFGGPAYGLDLGTHSLTASATDLAGNNTTTSTSFRVGVTYSSLCNLSRSFETDTEIAESLCAQLAAAESGAARDNANAKAGALRGYMNLVRAQAGKTLTSSQADILTRLAIAL